MGGGEIFEVFVVSNDVNQDCCSLEVFSPNFECLMDGQEFLVTHIVVEFHWIHGPVVESYQVYLTVSGVNNGKDCNNGIIQDIHFNDDQERMSGTQCDKTRAVVNASLSFLNAVLHSLEKHQTTFFLVSQVNGAAISE
jgi:hypothetical protein